ncbi:putative xanthine dehydrogenase/oxidase, partial [Apostichopus japonicus]
IEGAFSQGYGLFLLEDYRISPKGDLLTKGPGAYKLPSIGNTPAEFNVTLLDKSNNPTSIYSSKAVGEPPLFLSASVLFAVRDAITSARDDANLSSVFRLDTPAVPEKDTNGLSGSIYAKGYTLKHAGLFQRRYPSAATTLMTTILGPLYREIHWSSTKFLAIPETAVTFFPAMLQNRRRTSSHNRVKHKSNFSPTKYYQSQSKISFIATNSWRNELPQRRQKFFTFSE